MAARLPVAVNAITRAGAGLFCIELGFSDGSTGWYLLPETMATVESVRMSALAVAVLSEATVPARHGKGGRQQRYAPRP